MDLKQRWAALSPRGRFVSVGAVAVVLAAAAFPSPDGRTAAINEPTIAGRPSLAVPVATDVTTVPTPAPIDQSTPASAAQPTPTAELTATPTVQSTAAPGAQPAPTSAPPAPVAVAAIAFGSDHVQTDSDVTLVDQGRRFRAGSEVSWRVELLPASGTETILIRVANSAGRVVFEGGHEPEAGSSLYFGRAAIASTPGDYVMSYYLDGALIGQGSYAVVAGRASTTPEPPAQPAKRDCDPSYPTVCIAPPPPDLDCDDVRHIDFKVRGDDPHRFDGDGDGIGCESGGGSGSGDNPQPKATKEPKPDKNCDPSYPTLCLPSAPDLDCGDIKARNFPVRGRDPHGFDGDNDGRGCES